jgi:hypothetical protein
VKRQDAKEIKRTRVLGKSVEPSNNQGKEVVDVTPTMTKKKNSDNE